MDLEEWEVLSNEGFIDDHQGVTNNINNTTTLIEMDNYFQEFGVQNQSKDQNFDDQEMIISKLPFKNLKENQFVDMTIDLPKSLNMGNMGQFDEKEEKDCNFEVGKEENDEKLAVYEEKKIKMEENEGVNVWKWAMTGMGAFMSFGFAAVTVSLIVFSNRHKGSNNNQDLHFQLYPHDKRFKQVVRRAKRLNEAISAMRGAPMTQAHITIGGSYESL